MSHWTLLISYEVLEFVGNLPRKDQLSLRKRFLQIRDFPDQYSDYSEPDNIGRLLDMSICGRFAIKFWIDQADRHIKILDVHLADRRREK